MSHILELRKLLTQPRKIIIITHHQPDGDAMGSSLGLYNYLIQGEHHTHVITPTGYPIFLQWLPNNSAVIIYTENKTLATRLTQEAELIFCLDFNSLNRIDALKNVVRNSSAKKVMIDHHPEPGGFDDLRHWDSNACSTAILVYEFIVDWMEEKDKINTDVATCLYTGIMTDSGSFSLSTSTAKVHRIVADLIDAGAKNYLIHQLVYGNLTENRLRFLGYCLSSKLEVLREFHTALISISYEELQRFEVQSGDTEGIVNHILSINGIHLAACITEKTDKVRLSLRSRAGFPADEVCKKHFRGGGHRNAAGGIAEKPLNKVVEHFKTILPEYKNMLVQQESI